MFSFRLSGPIIFLLFRELCFLTRNTLEDSLEIFKKSDYVSTTLTQNTELQARAVEFLSDFKNQTPIIFQRTLQLHRDINQGNQLLTASYTNAFLYRAEMTGNSSQSDLEIWWTNSFDLTCNCGTSPIACAVSLASYCSFIASNLELGCFPSRNMTIIGFVLACQPVDGYLESTIDCMYDEMCIRQLMDLTVRYYNSTTIRTSDGRNISVLTSNAKSIFTPSTKLFDIVNMLMVENWVESVSFDSYYAECKPTVCLYTITERLSIVATIISLIGIAGGLSVVLRILSPNIVWLFRRIRRTRDRPLRPAWITTTGN